MLAVMMRMFAHCLDYTVMLILFLRVVYESSALMAQGKIVFSAFLTVVITFLSRCLTIKTPRSRGTSAKSIRCYS